VSTILYPTPRPLVLPHTPTHPHPTLTCRVLTPYAPYAYCNLVAGSQTSGWFARGWFIVFGSLVVAGSLVAGFARGWISLVAVRSWIDKMAELSELLMPSTGGALPRETSRHQGGFQGCHGWCQNAPQPATAGTVAAKVKYQKSTELLIPQLPFQRLVRELLGVQDRPALPVLPCSPSRRPLGAYLTNYPETPTCVRSTPKHLSPSPPRTYRHGFPRHIRGERACRLRWQKECCVSVLVFCENGLHGLPSGSVS
jgi:hypothetical protein